MMRLTKHSAFAEFHPAVLIFYFICILTVAVFTVNPIIVLLTLLGGMFFCGMISERKLFLKSLLHYLLLIIALSLANPIFSHHGDTPLFFMNGKPITLQAVLYGVNMSITVVAILMWCVGLTRTFTSDKIIYLFGKPFPKLAMVISMSLRFIPLFKDEYKKIENAQRAMGMFSSSGIYDRTINVLKTFSALITMVLEDSVDTALSMNGRGYGLPRRTSFSLFKFTVKDLFMILLNIGLISVVFFAIGSGAVDFYFYPSVAQLPLSITAITAYISYGILVFIPSLVELKGVIAWKLLRSRI